MINAIIYSICQRTKSLSVKSWLILDNDHTRCLDSVKKMFKGNLSAILRLSLAAKFLSILK